ncbi:MAG: TIM barrel protein [Planctomycetes bacterium]|nr:TIM barrel protein [Planctomycetota bacterium]
MPITPRVLFVCTGNAGRSQMAQAILRAAAGDSVEIESAGVQPWAALHPVAQRVMAARGLDMAGQFPKSAKSLAGRRFDVIVTLGDPALRELPHDLTTMALWEHWDIADPADADGKPESQAVFERTADAIAARLPALRTLLGTIASRSRRGGRIGASSGMWYSERFGLTTHLKQIADIGYDGLELCIYQGPHHFDPTDDSALRDLKHAADDLGVAIWSIHSRDPGSLGSPDPAERQRQIDELHFCLDLCERLGAKIVVSHGLITGRWADDRAEADRLLKESLDRLLPRSLASPASIAFENDTVTIPGRMGADVLSRLEPYPRAAFGFVLDPGHANIAGDTPLIAQRVGQRLISTHLNDNDGVNDIHFAPTEGTADWALIQAILRDSRYGGCVMYEAQPNGDDPGNVLRRTMDHHRRLWPQVVPD